MEEPVDHILRGSLPWRDHSAPVLTECGKGTKNVTTITRHEFFAREKGLGKQRTAMLTCMTCTNTVRRWGVWGDDPRLALGREIEWETARSNPRSRLHRGERLKDELLAIAEIIETHRDEFEALLSSKEQRREWLAKKEALKTKERAQ